MDIKKIPDELYYKILENVPICCVDLVIVQNSKILLIKRATEPEKNLWGFVGGRVLKKESLLKAAKRKAIEEIGVEVDVGEMIGIYETIFDKGPYPSLKTGVHTINITFFAKLKNPIERIKTDKFILEYKWFNELNDGVSEYVKKVLKEAKIFD